MKLEHNIPTWINPLFVYLEDYEAPFVDHICINGPEANGVFRIDFGRIQFERGVPAINGACISKVRQKTGITVGLYTLKWLAKSIQDHLDKYYKNTAAEVSVRKSKNERNDSKRGVESV